MTELGCGMSGEAILSTGTALAICIAREHTADEVALLAALFTTLGDQLALLALKKGECAENGSGP